jgi:hypothetical protein
MRYYKDMENNNNNVRFNQHHVTNGTHKARAWYNLDNRIDGRKVVTIYAKDYTNGLSGIFDADAYENNTDIMTDYFDKGTVRLFESHPLYTTARAAVVRHQAKAKAKIEAKRVTS